MKQGLGELCFVLATRQIGKSSLRLRAAKKLSAEGVACVHIDLTMLGTGTATAETWYVGLAAEIAEQLGLPRSDDFWEGHKALGPMHVWSRYLEDEVLARADRPIVVFVDEIDATLSLPFSRDDFFTAVRALHLRRLERAEGAWLTFCLLGVAAPGDLVEAPTRTTLNVGRSIRLEDFTKPPISLVMSRIRGGVLI